MSLLDSLLDCPADRLPHKFPENEMPSLRSKPSQIFPRTIVKCPTAFHLKKISCNPSKGMQILQVCPFHSSSKPVQKNVDSFIDREATSNSEPVVLMEAGKEWWTDGGTNEGQQTDS